ncbi:MAG: hypothetical protein EOO22_10130 [Comamonadaceae bacterium]|nr:MAG: hypothetical protein EOO22_10130 [Comamonadaceae bacterium]
MSFEAIHCFDRATVRFAIYPDGHDGPRILVEIGESALRDLFGARGGPADLLAACELHFPLIEAKALELYAAAPGCPLVLHSADFYEPAIHR